MDQYLCDMLVHHWTHQYVVHVTGDLSIESLVDFFNLVLIQSSEYVCAVIETLTALVTDCLVTGPHQILDVSLVFFLVHVLSKLGGNSERLNVTIHMMLSI